jgi:hypothetical protein
MFTSPLLSCTTSATWRYICCIFVTTACCSAVQPHLCADLSSSPLPSHMQPTTFDTCHCIFANHCMLQRPPTASGARPGTAAAERPSTAAGRRPGTALGGGPAHQRPVVRPTSACTSAMRVQRLHLQSQVGNACLTTLTSPHPLDYPHFTSTSLNSDSIMGDCQISSLPS